MIPLPQLSTDDSHDIENASKAHSAELDREAAEGMHPLPPAGVSDGDLQAAADLDDSIQRARGVVLDAQLQPAVTFLHDPFAALLHEG